MNKSFYHFHISPYALRFDFTSIGKRSVNKSIIYTKTDISNLYSVALVDVFEDGSSDDTSISNNGDMEKILATVYQTFIVFFQHYPNASIVFAGSTPSRTRLYRIAVSQGIEQLRKTYNIWGILIDSFEPYQIDRPYTGFILSLKSINIV